MSLEDRVQVSVDQAVRSLVQQVLVAAIEDRRTAVSAARGDARAEAEQAAEARRSDAEARHRRELSDALVTARSEERELAAKDVKSQVDAAARQQIAEAVASAEGRLGEALAEAQAHAAEETARLVAAARAGGREAEVARLSRLLESIRGLDGATSQAELLDALTVASAREAARAAVLVPRGDRIQGWRLSGFGSRDAHARAIDLTVGDAGVVGLALTTARATTTEEAWPPVLGPGFEQAAGVSTGIAVPVVAGGRVVAIVYADGTRTDGLESTVPPAWPALVEVLARHAGRCLDALAGAKATESVRQTGVA